MLFVKEHIKFSTSIAIIVWKRSNESIISKNNIQINI